VVVGAAQLLGVPAERVGRGGSSSSARSCTPSQRALMRLQTCWRLWQCASDSCACWWVLLPLLLRADLCRRGTPARPSGGGRRHAVPRQLACLLLLVIDSAGMATSTKATPALKFSVSSFSGRPSLYQTLGAFRPSAIAMQGARGVVRRGVGWWVGAALATRRTAGSARSWPACVRRSLLPPLSRAGWAARAGQQVLTGGRPAPAGRRWGSSGAGRAAAPSTARHTPSRLVMSCSVTACGTVCGGAAGRGVQGSWAGKRATPPQAWPGLTWRGRIAAHAERWARLGAARSGSPPPVSATQAARKPLDGWSGRGQAVQQQSGPCRNKPRPPGGATGAPAGDRECCACHARRK